MSFQNKNDSMLLAQIQFLIPLILFVLLLAGCATTPQNMTPVVTDEVFDRVFRDMVREPLSGTIQDWEANKILNYDSTGLSPDRKIEFELLKIIQQCDGKRECSTILEGHWQKESVVKDFVVHFKDINLVQSPEYAFPICLLAYLSQESDFLNSAQVFNKLDSIRLSRVQGYAFSYYFLASVRNGDLSRVDDFCNRLKKVKPEAVYKQDILALANQLTPSQLASPDLAALPGIYWDIRKGEVIDLFLTNQCRKGTEKLQEIHKKMPKVETVEEFCEIRSALSQCDNL